MHTHLGKAGSIASSSSCTVVMKMMIGDERVVEVSAVWFGSLLLPPKSKCKQIEVKQLIQNEVVCVLE